MASDYDKIIKENIEAVFLPVIDKLLGIRSDGAFEELPDDMQVTIERRPDFMKRVAVEGALPYILHIEFQSTDKTDMVYRMLEYRALLNPEVCCAGNAVRYLHRNSNSQNAYITSTREPGLSLRPKKHSGLRLRKPVGIRYSRRNHFSCARRFQR